MKNLPLAVLVAMLVVGAADAQTTTRLRGTITAIDGNTMSVKSREGTDVKVQLPDNVVVAVAKAIKFEDIKQGDLLGVTSMPGPDGAMNAIEVHYLPPSVPEGQGPWDLRPGSTMTNAKVSSIVEAADKRELTLTFKESIAKVRVPPNAPIVRAVPGSRSDLRPGEYIFAGVQTAADGTMTAPRIQVSKDGVKPPL